METLHFNYKLHWLLGTFLSTSFLLCHRAALCVWEIQGGIQKKELTEKLWSHFGITNGEFQRSWSPKGRCTRTVVQNRNTSLSPHKSNVEITSGLFLLTPGKNSSSPPEAFRWPQTGRREQKLRTETPLGIRGMSVSVPALAIF